MQIYLTVAMTTLWVTWFSIY